MFTARSRQNAFAKKRRELREAREAAEAQAEPTAVPYDTRNDASDDITDAPDVSTFAAGGIVELVEPIPAPVDTSETETDHYAALPVISPETQAKIDAVVNHAIPVADKPTHPGSRGAETMRPHGTAAAEAAESDAKRGRGRPRPQETIDRDNAVHALLVGADADSGISKEQIAVALDGEKEQQVYSSLRQLTKEGRAETRYVKPHGYRWFAL